MEMVFDSTLDTGKSICIYILLWSSQRSMENYSGYSSESQTVALLPLGKTYIYLPLSTREYYSVNLQENILDTFNALMAAWIRLPW